MRLLLVALLFFIASGCSLVASENDQVLVRVNNETRMSFTKVVLDLGSSDASQAVFQDVAPGTETRFNKVQEAHSQPFTVYAYTHDRELAFHVDAFVPILLEPGRYTYTLMTDEADNFIVYDR